MIIILAISVIIMTCGLVQRIHAYSPTYMAKINGTSRSNTCMTIVFFFYETLAKSCDLTRAPQYH